jgi:uncharacterized protein (UPF0332 family)
MTDHTPDDYIKYRLQKAKETLAEVEIHISNQFWNTAINRMYYAAFYAVNALLVKNKIEVNSHTGVRQKFGQHYIKTGLFNKQLAKHYTDLFEKRHKSDYNDFFDYDEETTKRLLPLTKEFIQNIEQLIDNK